MAQEDKRVTVGCSCGCCEVQFTKYVWEELGEVDYDIAIVDSRYDNNPNSILGRVRRALGILFGKPVAFNDACISEERFAKLLEELGELAVD